MDWIFVEEGTETLPYGKPSNHHRRGRVIRPKSKQGKGFLGELSISTCKSNKMLHFSWNFCKSP